MDPTTDPRLQHFPINVADFPYSAQSASNLQGVQYEQNLQNYAFNLQQEAAVQIPSANVSPQRSSQRNVIQYSPQSTARVPRSRPAQTIGNPVTPLRNTRSPTKVTGNSYSQQQQQRQPPPPQAIDFNNLPPNYASINPVHQLQGRQQPNTAPSYFPVQGLQSQAGVNPSANPQPSYFTSHVTQHTQPTTSTTQNHVHTIANDIHHSPDTTTTIQKESVPANDSQNPFSATFPLITDPPNLSQWRSKLFNITSPLVLSETEYLTYFPHIDNVYSHRSTQKYKRKPFVSHYWDCRLKGRPSGTKKSDDPNKKKRKRTARERDLCDVKIKVTEYFSWDECRRLGLTSDGSDGGSVVNTHDGLGTSDVTSAIDTRKTGIRGNASDGSDAGRARRDELTIVMEDGAPDASPPAVHGAGVNAFGLLEPAKRFPKGHPGAEGKRWFIIQRVNGNAGIGGGDEGRDEHADKTRNDNTEQQGSNAADVNLDHKHTLEESDKIKKNSVQRWQLKEEKENKSGKKGKNHKPFTGTTSSPLSSSQLQSSQPTYYASGQAQQTARLHKPPASSQLTLYGNSFCPFAQRIWIALEIKQIPYQYVEMLPPALTNQNQNKPQWTAEMTHLNPEHRLPAIKHGNWCVWDSSVMMEYLEDLAMGHCLLPLGNPQLRAHCRLWTDHINRKVLPAFYSLLLSTPAPAMSYANGDANSQGETTARETALAERHSMLITTLHTAITSLVNASHATGPFFLGSEISFVDIAFAPWIIRLSRVLSYYRSFPRPEVGTRWQSWVDAVEADERVRRTVSDDRSYHNVYRGVAEEGWDGTPQNIPKKSFVEWKFATRIVAQEGFGLGGDARHMAEDDPQNANPRVGA